MVDEEAPADRCTRMDLDPGEETTGLGDEARGKAQLRLLPHLVGEPMNPDGMEAGVSEEVLDVAAGCGIVGPGGLEVLPEPRESAFYQ